MKYVVLLVGGLVSMENLSLFSFTGLYVVPPVVALGIAASPLLLPRFEVTDETRAILQFLGWIVLAALIWLFIDLAFLGAPPSRMTYFVKQLVALTGGFCVFLFFRAIFRRCAPEAVFRGLLLGATPALALGVLTVFARLTGADSWIDLIDSFRQGLLGPTISGAEIGRTSGLSNEPAHFGAYIAVLVLPAAVGLAALRKVRGRRLTRPEALVALSALVCLLFTFSGTAYGVAVAMLVIFLLRSENLNLKNVVAVVLLIGAGALLVLDVISDNYLLMQLASFEDGGVSWIAKYGSTFAPLIQLAESMNPFGYGLGGTNFHADSIIPPFMFDAISAVSYEDELNLKTAVGRLLAESGIVGVALFCRVVWVSLRRCGRWRPFEFIYPPVAVGLLVAMASGNIGSLSNPLIWLWLAFWDSQRLISRTRPDPVFTVARE